MLCGTTCISIDLQPDSDRKEIKNGPIWPFFNNENIEIQNQLENNACIKEKKCSTPPRLLLLSLLSKIIFVVSLVKFQLIFTEL